MPQFADKADIRIQFQPFTLYPVGDPNKDSTGQTVPPGNNQGVDKVELRAKRHAMRNGAGYHPVESARKMQEQMNEGLGMAWKEEGLTLAPVAGRWGQSFDAQRLISLARKQDREMAMVEEIYSGNHEKNIPLSDWSFLLEAAERAGVQGAEEMLKSDQEEAEVKAKIQKHVDMGINSVPVLVINDRTVINGAPDHQTLVDAIANEVQRAAL